MRGMHHKHLFAKHQEAVVLINVFEVPEGKVDEAVASWEKSRDFLAKQPGYINTRLHKSLNPNGKFALVNIAQWETQQDFAAATAKMRNESDNPLPQGTQAHPALYEVIRADGKDPFSKMWQKRLEHKYSRIK
ncbi:antibiotic biosynthesis monooxygenase [Neisseria animalis]|uniref:Antibiotic biosynthesis monooxygenase n=2 Tax=Neisseria animalis TaxID=492 RepID=A0A5P3MTQ5_NEIAN|nr:antibiotic biosynthesis monooxygenase [Neisseria animalis]ROW32700.1 antibiotic biosynthesis monooxygenase [Neisseria animalis]